MLREKDSFRSYQEQATTTAIYPGQGTFLGLAYAALGLNGEAGETADQVKKIWRDEGADIEVACLLAVDKMTAALEGGENRDDAIEIAKARVSNAFLIPVTAERRERIIKELGDTLWYAAQVATELGLDLGEIASANIDKLSRRSEQNLVSGEGSDR